MQRRDVLKLLGSAPAWGMLPAPALASKLGAKAAPLDALQQCAERFAAARKTHPFLAGWESVAPSGTAKIAATLKGKWPSALRGTLYRNGPGLFDRGGQRYQHWFDGDGLVQAWQIGAEGVTHQSRFVNTPKFARENRSNKFEVMAAGTTIPDARAVSGPDDANTANISILHVGGKTYAIWEAGSAFEIDRESLETIGPKVWRDDLEGAAFSAHPVYDADGSIWNVGLFDTKLLIYHVAPDGTLISAEVVQLPHSGYMHSFSASESQLVFVLAPLVRVRDAGSYFEGLGWKPELGSLMVIVPKADLSKPRFAEFASGAAYHYSDCWDEKDGSIALRACWYETGKHFVSPFGRYVQGYTDNTERLGQELVEIRLAPGAKRATLSRVGHSGVEFPIPTKLTRKSPAIYLQGNADKGIGALTGVLSVDASAKQLGHFDFGPDFVLEEQLYVRAGGKRYSLGTIFNAKLARTGLVLLDLDRLGDGPIAQAWLSGAMPLGFHGSFLTESFH
jgi:all-trans-8'-apo-beta-carotenal 15,15'-oxygenase